MSDLNFSSPWLEQLKTDRPHFKLEKDADCDVAVVGAGIAGVATSYHLLKHTDSKVLLIEAGRIAHGATGRNAGQVVNCFERSFGSIVEEFGKEMSAQGHLDIESAWGMLEDIITECKLSTPFYRCMGYTGIIKMEELIETLEEQCEYDQAGLKPEMTMLSLHANVMKDIPDHLKKYVIEVPHSVVLESICTDDPSFIASSGWPVGCLNSALFCEELVGWMVETYPNRFTVAEHLPVTTVTLKEDDAIIETTGPVIHANRVVLCTNGFENFEIKNLHGKDIDPSFHATVLGRIAYMTAYLDAPNQGAIALSYNSSTDEQNPYYYVTRRPYEHATHGAKTLLCVGGPERDLPNCADYDPNNTPPQDITEDLNRIANITYNKTPPENATTFAWHGLMGHTPNRIRRIGFEPRNPVLLYNLGCNGVGILASIYGGFRIAQLVKGIHLPPSIFDPKE